MAKARYEVLSGRISGERQRWQSSAGDSVVMFVVDDSGDEFCVKGRESLGSLYRGLPCVFFGNWGRYRNEPQFAFFGYCHPEEREKVTALMDLFMGRGFPRDLACRCVEKEFYLADVVKNPFNLLRFGGCGFKRCDDLWLYLQKPPESLKRQAICLDYQLRTSDDGSSWHSERDAWMKLSQAIPVGTNFHRAAALATRAGLLEKRRTDDDGLESWDGDQVWYASKPVAVRESQLAGYVDWHLDGRDTVRRPEISQGQLSDHQYEMAQRALSRSLGILTGGGGTGKTFTVAHVVDEIASTSANDLLLVAPTGKAAVRMTEAVGGRFSARTIHSALKYRGNVWEVQNLADEGFRFVIADECSMIDEELMWRLLRASTDCRVLLVGDPGQLPPVGIGAPFRDIIAAHPAVGHLTETRRNSGEIVAAANLIREGKWFGDHLNRGNLLHEDVRVPEDSIRTMLEAIKQAQADGYDPVWDVQVIAQVKQRSALSTGELNKVLQLHLNPNRPDGGVFALGDKVLNLKNSWLTPARNYPQSEECVTNDSGEIYVANGDMGKVVEIQAKYMVVELQSPMRNVMAPTWETDSEESDEGDTGSKFTLGYAITAHKCQGAEIPFAICMIDSYPGARRMLDRSMLYTIMTRGKQKCLLLGERRIMQAAIQKNSIWNRKTFLRERIVEKLGQPAILSSAPSLSSSTLASPSHSPS